VDPIVVVGQVARDLVLVVDQVPEAGSSVDVGRRRELLGGKGANIAVSVAQLGAPVAVVGVVGDDLVGEQLLAQAARDGLDISAVRRRGTCESALMVDIVTADGQWRYLESVPPGALLTADDIDQARDLLHAARTVILQLQQPADAILAALDALRPGGLVIMDGVPEEESTRDRILSAASVLRLDAHEAEVLIGHPIPDEAAARETAARLLGHGPDLVVLAVGTDGNLVTWASDAVLLPLIDTGPQVDTTGGGDAFVATLAWALDRGEDRVRAARLATAAAGLVVTHPGGRPALDAATVEQWTDRVGADR
jgi:ribokinase